MLTLSELQQRVCDVVNMLCIVLQSRTVQNDSQESGFHRLQWTV